MNNKKSKLLFFVILISITSISSCNTNKRIIKKDGESDFTEYDSYRFIRHKNKIKGQFSIKIIYYKNNKKVEVIKSVYVPYLTSNFLISERVKVMDSTGRIVYQHKDKRHPIYDLLLKNK